MSVLERPEALPAVVPIDRWPADAPGPSRRPCDALVLMLPKPLAGLGTARQLDCLASAVGSWTTPPVVYVGPALASDLDLLRAPFESIPVTTSVTETYATCVVSLTAALRRLLEQGCRRPAVLALGYTAFGPEAAKRTYRALAADGLESIDVLIADSAFPDRDAPQREVDAEGWPLTRFYEDSYESQGGVMMSFLLTSAYPLDPRVLATRVPAVDAVRVVAPPYTDAYVRGLAEAAARGRAGGPLMLEDRWPHLRAWQQGDLFVPLVSSDIWSPSSVGAWMTEQEYATVVHGTKMILEGLARVAADRKSTIFVPVDAAVEAVMPLASGYVRHDGVKLLPYTGLPQDKHAEMLGASHFALSRTGGQSNAFVVLAVAETPTLIVDLPDAGYMQAELTSLAAEYDIAVSENGDVSCSPSQEPLAYLARWDWDADRLAALVERIAGNPEEARSRAAAAHRAFDGLRTSPQTSVLALLGELLEPGN